MRYTGTIKQVYELETYLKIMGNCIKMRDGKIPKSDGQLNGEFPTSYTNIYEVYLDHRAKEFAQASPDKWIYLISFPHAVLRFAYYERDDKATVDINPVKLPRLLAMYPVIAELLIPLHFKENYRQNIDHSKARV